MILLIAAVVQAAAPPFLFFDGFDQGSARPPTPVVPADYAFVIWGLIYGLSLLFAGLQFRHGANYEVLRDIGYPAIFLFMGSTLWLLFARFGPKWGTVPVIIAMAALAILIVIRLGSARPAKLGLDRCCAPALFGLYAGWLTVATFANFTEVAVDLGFSFLGLGLANWSTLALAAATVVAYWVTLKAMGNWSYTAAIVWALIAVVVANRIPGREQVATVSIAGAAILVVATLWAARRRRLEART